MCGRTIDSSYTQESEERFEGKGEQGNPSIAGKPEETRLLGDFEHNPAVCEAERPTSFGFFLIHKVVSASENTEKPCVLKYEGCYFMIKFLEIIRRVGLYSGVFSIQGSLRATVERIGTPDDFGQSGRSPGEKRVQETQCGFR